jgi:hypothetical protein
MTLFALLTVQHNLSNRVAIMNTTRTELNK